MPSKSASFLISRRQLLASTGMAAAGAVRPASATTLTPEAVSSLVSNLLTRKGNVLAQGQTPTSVALDIDAEQQFQTMEGFGATARVFDDPHLTETFDPATQRSAVVVPESAQEEILDKLYTELGFTRLRPGTDARGIETVNDNDDPAVTDLGNFNFAWKRNDAHIDLARRAIDRGVDTYFLSPIQPFEEWITEANPEEYVEWAMVIIRRWRDQGVTLPYYSVMNEPGFPDDSVWSGEYIRDVIKLMGPQLRAEGFETQFVITDDLNASEAYKRSEVILADPAARQYVGALGFHLYGEPVDRVVQMQELGQRYDLPLWMTEYFQRDAFAWANTMQSLIADYDVSAVDYMWGFFGQWETNGSHLIVVTYDAANTYTGYNLRKHYFVMGQFSRYVRPGAVRVQATSSDPAIRVSAFRDGDAPVIVVINNAKLEQTVDVSLSGFTDITTLRPIRTTALEDWAELDSIQVRGSAFTAALAANSVTTFIGQ